MYLPMQQVDVFTDQPLAGNPLAVFWNLPPQFPGFLMQQLAREMNLSESIFITALPDPDSHYSVRIFTPETELPFAGHPSLGGFFSLCRHGLLTNQGVQHSEAGASQLAMDAQGLIWVTPPPGHTEEIKLPMAHIAEALGVDLSWISVDTPPGLAGTGLLQLIVPLATDQVSLLRPDPVKLQGLGARLGATGVYVLAQTGPATYHARFFGMGIGIGEDPATGSAAAAFGTYLLKTTGATAIQRYKIYQGAEIGRPSLLWVRLNAHGVGSLDVGGSVVPVLEGTVEIPDDRVFRD